MASVLKQHPTLGILVCSDGHIMIPATEKSKAHWTLGSKQNKGYLRVRINYKEYLVHRLVAETFIPNPEEKQQVDHINRDREDNRVENLRWVDSCENQRNTLKYDRVESRKGTHIFDNRKKYYNEYYKRNPQKYIRPLHKYVLFNDGKKRWITIEHATELLKLPVKDRVYGK